MIHTTMFLGFTLALILLRPDATLGADPIAPVPLSPTWRSFLPPGGARASIYGVSDIVEHDGMIWIGTEAHGLWRYRDGQLEDLSARIPAPHVRAIVPGSDNSLRIIYDEWGGRGSARPGDKNGVLYYRQGQWRQYDVPDTLFSGFAFQLNHVFKTKDDSLWFLTLGRAFRFRQGTWTIMSSVRGARHLLEAADGTIWITGEDGERIWRSNGDAMQPVVGNNGVTFEYPNSLVQAPDGTLWIGDNGLVSFRDGKFSRTEPTPTFDDNRIWPEFMTRDGTLLVATAFGGLFPYRDGQWTKAENSEWPYAGPIIEARDNTVWYGVNSHQRGALGVVSYKKGLWRRFDEITPNVVPKVESLHEGADGSIWVGLRTGYIARYNAGRWHTIPRKPPDSIAANSEGVSAWANASDGTLWVGMNNGEVRQFRPSKATLTTRGGTGVVSLDLKVERGRRDVTEWSVRYGFSGSPDTAPSEVFDSHFTSRGEAQIAVPDSALKTYLHAVAIDTDGTSIPLDGQGIYLIANGSAGGAKGRPIELPLPSGTITKIDGVALPSGGVVFRGPTDGLIDTAYSRLSDGFHQVELRVRDASVRLALYKEKLKILVFRPFGRSVSVVIAVSGYPSASGYPPLPDAERQAAELADYLVTQGFEVIRLFGPRATKKAIQDTLGALKLGSNDRLLVYFGGHGDSRNTPNDDIGYIVPINGAKSNLDMTAVSVSTLALAAESSAAKQVLLALDSCQSGYAIKRGDVDADALRRLKGYQDIAYYSQGGRAILTAGFQGEPALDVNGGIFTRALLKGIRGAADREVGDGNGVVDFYELFSYVHREVTRDAANRGYLQHPDFAVGAGAGRFFFVTDRSLEH